MAENTAPRRAMQPGRKFPCPYCFEEIEHNKVHFLSASAVADSVHIKTPRELEADGATAEEIQENDLLGKFQYRKEDEKLYRFWVRQERGGEAAYTSYPYGENYSWNSPLITPENAGEMCERGYEKDDAGMVVAIHDRLNGRLSKMRLCPHCHNPLPNDYGRNPITFISIVGITSSGKTVYLSQLIPKIGIYLAQIGRALGAQQIGGDLAQIGYGNLLPPSTKTEIMRRPMSVTAVKKAKVPEPHTLIFYDIAGENCVNAQRMEQYGAYIKNADGIILLLDPHQFQGIMRHFGGIRNADDPASVVRAMYEHFLQDRMRNGQVADLPLALTIAKSDFFETEPVQQLAYKREIALNPNSNMFAHIDHQNEGFHYQQYSNISMEIRRLLESCDQPLCQAISTYFAAESVGYFAVSSLGCSAKYVLYTSRVGEPILDLKDQTAEDVKALIRDGIPLFVLDMDTEGGRVFIDVDPREIPETADRSSKQLFFKVEEGGRLRKISRRSDLELKDQAALKNAIYYTLGQMPSEEPAPKRIEEPFQWLMWKLGLADAARPAGDGPDPEKEDRRGLFSLFY